MISVQASPTSGCSLLLEMPRTNSDVVLPLERVRAIGRAPEGTVLEVRDGAGRLYFQTTLDGDFSVEWLAGGTLGWQSVQLALHGQLLLQEKMRIDAISGIESTSSPMGELWTRLESVIKPSRDVLFNEGKNYLCYVPWVRDDTHVQKAYKFWESGVGELQQRFLEKQRPNGMIYDYFRPIQFATDRKEVFGPGFYEEDAQDGIRWERLPSEADVEYLLVEGIYNAWKARGDTAWLIDKLAGLEKALRYSMSDPLRWSPQFRLVQRPYTIDTWDFKYFGYDRTHLQSHKEEQDAVFMVHPDTPMCIMHGDNSGMFQACNQMASMYEAIGEYDKSACWNDKARHFKEAVDRHCWNGQYYDHWVPVTPLPYDQGGIDGCKVLSLSNAYNLNRGLPDHAQCVSIIRSYQRLRETTRDTHFAEWLSVHPCWPKGYSGIMPGQYVNGGILTLVAGELAKGSFHHGCEEYGADILKRLYALLHRHARNPEHRFTIPQPYLYAAYTPDGKPSYGMPDTWGQAAVISALMEGLSGIEDLDVRYETVRVSPRWTAMGEKEALVTARYGASDGYVRYRFAHYEPERQIEFCLTGNAELFVCEILLPPGTRAVSLEQEEASVPFTLKQVEQSVYVCFQIVGPFSGRVQLAYEAAV